jgi:hypothetical protein
MGDMERVSVRDLRLKTSALLKNVAQGQTYVIESRGVPVPNCAQSLHTAPPIDSPIGTDTGKILEEDRI